MAEQRTAPIERESGAAPRKAAPLLVVAGLERRIGRGREARTILDGVDLELRDGEILTILGPPASGKTTLLRVVAGAIAPEKGSITLANRDVTARPPAEREIGAVWRDRKGMRHLLSPGLALPPRGHGARRPSAAQMASALALVGLAENAARTPRRLTEAQRLRFALAQALAHGPRLLLLDDCFRGLAAAMRTQMQAELRRLQRRLAIATMFATDDREQALLLADRIAAMHRGRIAQIGTPEELHRQPASRFVAELMGEANLFRGRGGVIGGPPDGRTIEVRLENGGTMRAALPAGDRSVHYGADLAVVVRPDRPRRLAPDEPADNRVAGIVGEAVYLGETIRYRVALDGGGEMVLRWPAAAERLHAGMRIQLGWSPSDATAVLWS